ncbi:MAG: 50S ribosomal protein L1 [Patescibacteria group bacterium]
MKLGKRLKEASTKIDRSKSYPLAEAVALAQETSKVKFDASLELHMNLNIDAKKGDQLVRATVALPYGTGKVLRIAAFVPEDQIKEAQAAGADIVGSQELIEEIKKTNKCDFDIAVATPDMMKNLAPIARILGQKGLMPNPKTGTIALEVTKLIQALKKGKISYKNDGGGTIHVAFGKVSFPLDQLIANAEALVDSIRKAKPQSVKGTFVRSVFISSSMGPSIRAAI